MPSTHKHPGSPQGKKRRKVRLDALLVEQGYFPDADAALRAVIARKVRVDDAYATSAAAMVRPDADIFVRGQKRFVSRGGHKLQGAIDAFGQEVSGLRCIDVGSSTGGFTDCLLQAGAASVACVDVNYGQLAMKLRQDERVKAFERTNIKLADPALLGAPFDLIVIDVSFIGLAQLAPTLARLARNAPASPAQPNGNEGGAAQATQATRAAQTESSASTEQPTVLIGLVKPQFESQHEETDHGVVRDESVRLRTVDEVAAALEASGFAVTGVIESPITGPKGNVEYLIRAVYEGAS